MNQQGEGSMEKQSKVRREERARVFAWVTPSQRRRLDAVAAVCGLTFNALVGALADRADKLPAIVAGYPPPRVGRPRVRPLPENKTATAAKHNGR